MKKDKMRSTSPVRRVPREKGKTNFDPYQCLSGQHTNYLKIGVLRPLAQLAQLPTMITPERTDRMKCAQAMVSNDPFTLARTLRKPVTYMTVSLAKIEFSSAAITRPS